MKPDKGFTLLELMIVLLISGILIAVGIPNMLNIVRANRLTSQANDLMTSIAMARSEAIKRGVPVNVCRSAEGATPNCGGAAWDQGWAVFADTNGNDAFNAGEPILLVRGPITGNNTIAASNNIANRVRFTAQGVVGAGGIGNFLITDAAGAAKGTRLICLAMTGRARVFGDGTSACPGGVAGS